MKHDIDTWFGCHKTNVISHKEHINIVSITLLYIEWVFNRFPTSIFSELSSPVEKSLEMKSFWPVYSVHQGDQKPRNRCNTVARYIEILLPDLGWLGHASQTARQPGIGYKSGTHWVLNSRSQQSHNSHIRLFWFPGVK